MKLKKCSKILLTLTLLGVLSSCTTAPLTGRKQLSLVSDESIREKSVSSYNELISQASAKGLLANDTADGQRLRRIGNKMASAVEQYLRDNNLSSKAKNLNWEFNLIKSNEVNAFAMPGGKIAFYTAILPVLKTDSGIAFVMGHEIGHVIGGHHSEGASNQALAGVAASVTGLFAGNLTTS